MKLTTNVDILKVAIDWAKAEVFSSTFFIFFGFMFMISSVGFWYLGKTDISKSYFTPLLITGSLLLIIGAGLLYGNKMRIIEFKKSYEDNRAVFINSELVRADKTMQEYKTIVFKVVPLIIIICAILIVLFDKAIIRSGSIATLAMMVVILLIDGTAKDRIENYREKLLLSKTNKD